MKHYVGPYVQLPIEFDYRPWDSLIVNTRGHLYRHFVDPVILIPRNPLDTISRSFYCGNDVVQINPATLVREIGAFCRLIDGLLSSLDDDGDINGMGVVVWGIVLVVDEELPSRGHVPGLNKL